MLSILDNKAFEKASIIVMKVKYKVGVCDIIILEKFFDHDELVGLRCIDNPRTIILKPLELLIYADVLEFYDSEFNLINNESVCCRVFDSDIHPDIDGDVASAMRIDDGNTLIIKYAGIGDPVVFNFTTMNWERYIYNGGNK